MSRNAKINSLLLLVVAALAVLPLALGLGDHKEEPFTGADGEAEAAITELRPDYEPWFTPLYEPPSGEIESALFSLQAALGAGVLAYYFGLRKGRRQGEARALAAAEATCEAGASGEAGAPPAGGDPAGTTAKAGAAPGASAEVAVPPAGAAAGATAAAAAEVTVPSEDAGASGEADAPPAAGGPAAAETGARKAEPSPGA